MELIIQIGIFVLALVALLKASDWFVDAAEEIGLSFGISPFIIGVTIVAFGTSLPELASSIAAVYDGNSEIVIANVVGSNIANILLVMGLVAVVSKSVEMEKRILDLDIPLLLGSAFFLWFVVRDAHVSMVEAILFLVALVFFLVNSFSTDDNDGDEERPTTSWKAYAFLLVGGVLVYFGATYTISALEAISKIAQIPSETISQSLLALGTSLPEVVVSLAAARKGQAAMAVGNVLGSNIFNTYAVMAIPALIADLTIPAEVLSFGLPFMVAITILFSVMCITRRVSRWEGAMLLILYTYFMVDLFA